MGRFRRGAVVAVMIACAVPPVASGSVSAASSEVTPPPANGRFDYQLGGSYPPVSGVRIVDRDRTSRPVKGRYNICYVNGFQTQDYQAEWWRREHPDLLLRDGDGELVGDPNWPGEYLLDASTAAKRKSLAAIIGRWIDGCARKGFDAIDPDNLDSNTRSHGLLTLSDNLAFAALLAERAHAAGLAIGQKNLAGKSAKAHRVAHFDFAMVESCQVYKECGDFLRTYGNEVFETEYSAASFKAACAARGDRISVIRRDHDMVARGEPGYVYKAC